MAVILGVALCFCQAKGWPSRLKAGSAHPLAESRNKKAETIDGNTPNNYLGSFVFYETF